MKRYVVIQPESSCRRRARRCASALFVLLAAVCAAAQTKQSVTVGTVRVRPVPVEMVGVQLGGATHEFVEVAPRQFEASFDAPEDWLRDFALTIKNTTDKTVVAVNLSAALSTGTAGEIPMSADMRFGQELDESGFTGRAPRGEPRRLLPGETGEVRRTAAEYSELVRFLSHKHPANDYRKMRVDVSEVRFDDDTVWSQGKLYRIDPSDPRKWIPLSGSADARPKLPELGAEEKLIVVFPQPRSPGDGVLRLISIKVAGQTITPGRPFVAGDQWLGDLSLRIKNTSTKPIVSARLYLSLPETKYRAGGVGTSLQYGKRSFGKAAADAPKPLMPGEEAELSFVPAEHENTRDHIRTHGGIDTIRYVRLGTALVTFADGAVTHVGNLIEEARSSGENDGK